MCFLTEFTWHFKRFFILNVESRNYICKVTGTSVLMVAINTATIFFLKGCLSLVSAVFVTKVSAGDTPIDIINKLALPPSNKALIESEVMKEEVFK